MVKDVLDSIERQNPERSEALLFIANLLYMFSSSGLKEEGIKVDMDSTEELELYILSNADTQGAVWCQLALQAHILIHYANKLET